MQSSDEIKERETLVIGLAASGKHTHWIFLATFENTSDRPVADI